MIVVTPEATVLDEQVDFVALPLYDGEIGIAPGRSPMIGRLGYGELRLVDGRPDDALLRRRRLRAGGRQRGLGADQLGPCRPRRSTRKWPPSSWPRRVPRKANSEELLAARDRLERQARAQLRVASRAR